MIDISVIGMAAAVLTTSSFAFQVMKTWKTKSTQDISLLMYSTIFIGVILWLVYGYMIQDWPLMIANGITAILQAIIIALKLKNG